MEAQKIKKKLNGSILKGSKIRVEEARPEKRLQGSSQDEEDEKDSSGKRATKTAKIEKKRKREEGVLPGFELPAERKVMRGWTDPTISAKESKAKKSGEDKRSRKENKAKAVPSIFSGEAECLFRTKMPLNAADKSSSNIKSAEKSKKRKSGQAKREIVVHEFANNTKHPSFLRNNNDTNGKKPVAEHVDGKGWVDEDGSVVEPTPDTERVPRMNQSAMKTRQGPSSREEVSEAVAVQEYRMPKEQTSMVQGDDTSSSGTSSDSEDEQDNENIPSPANRTNASQIKSRTISNTQVPIRPSTSSFDSQSAFDGKSVSVQDPSSPAQESEQTVLIPAVMVSSTGNPTEVHPLEALFKRPKSTSSEVSRKPPNLELKTSFSFFTPDNDSSDTNHQLMPQTPFTQRDLQNRSMRSAAPTPDTAAPGKTGFGNLWGNADGVEGSEDEDENRGKQRSEEVPSVAKKTSEGAESEEKPAESDFAKWFWEHRGENNRAWKRRKREAGKEKRQRENRREGRSAI